jgi:hypothetical protein
MLVSIVKMATVFECVILKSSGLLCVFLWAKGLNAKNVHKEIFSVYGGKCLSCKAFHVDGKYFADDEEIETEVRKWLRQESKDFYAAGFDALVKRWDKCVSVGG